jgi:hypothetical protein
VNIRGSRSSYSCTGMTAAARCPRGETWETIKDFGAAGTAPYQRVPKP